MSSEANEADLRMKVSTRGHLDRRRVWTVRSMSEVDVLSRGRKVVAGLTLCSALQRKKKTKMHMARNKYDATRTIVRGDLLRIRYRERERERERERASVIKVEEECTLRRYEGRRLNKTRVADPGTTSGGTKNEAQARVNGN